MGQDSPKEKAPRPGGLHTCPDRPTVPRDPWEVGVKLCSARKGVTLSPGPSPPPAHHCGLLVERLFKIRGNVFPAVCATSTAVRPADPLQRGPSSARTTASSARGSQHRGRHHFCTAPVCELPIWAPAEVDPQGVERKPGTLRISPQTCPGVHLREWPQDPQRQSEGVFRGQDHSTHRSPWACLSPSSGRK